MENKDELITELRNCAEQLTKLANDNSQEVTKQANVNVASSAREDYMHGVMVALGLED